MAIKFKTRITEMLGIEHPILCGGMQWISRAEIAWSMAADGCYCLTCLSIPYINTGKTRRDFDATEVLLEFFNLNGRSQ